MPVLVGYDIGTISIKRVVLKDDKIIDILPYLRHHGKFIDIIIEDLKALSENFPTVDGLAFTGCGGKKLAESIDVTFVNEIEALITGTKYLYPDARTVIEIGGEHSKFVDLCTNDFSMNELCAAGTGSFLDQQASRFNMSVADFASLALKAKKPATIAGRCSVFAKSDMIHLQQEGTPDEEIAMGLCWAVARSFKAGIAKGKDFIPPVIFCGGLAFNQAVVKAFEEIGKQNIIVPDNPESVPAIGAALALKTKQIDKSICLSEKIELLSRHSLLKEKETENLPRLEIVFSKLQSENKSNMIQKNNLKIAVGIDVGSISTNVVAIDTDKNLIAKVYIRTAGRPIEAVKKGISLLYEKLPSDVEVVACGTTGSGRYLTGDLVGADTVINEITAQARAAVHIDSEVDTIFEIGGQDSKYISLQNGVVIDFEMNKICAAGTGSFLEEQAERFNIAIEDFGDIALTAQSPLNLGERCTVFMETNVYAHFQKGASIPDILAGLSYSIVTNYLNRVVGRKKIGNKIFFQGAVAFNKSVVAAFEKTLNKPIIVPCHHEVTGAIGAAIVALEKASGKSNFRGFKEIIGLTYQQSSFICSGCSNHCEIKKVSTADSRNLFYGGRCEKYEVRTSDRQKASDLFAQRNELLFSSYYQVAGKNKDSLKIGIPRAMLTYEFLPFWSTFFSELGFSVVVSDETNRDIINAGLEASAAETCFPVKVALGHVQNLLDKNVDLIFLPVIRDMPCDYKRIDGTRRGSYTCPYVQAISTIAKSCLKLPKKMLLEPVINFSFRNYSKRNQLLKIGRMLGKDNSTTLKAANAAFAAQNRFKQLIRDKGRTILESLPSDAVIAVILGRPYNCCDRAVCMDIPEKLRNLGFWVLPLDYLPLEKVDIFEKWPNLYWEFGYRMMSALEIIKQDTRLYPVYITNFGCGPDSFLLQYFERQLDKPFLKIEVDEHTAGAGIITRCEAFADSLNNYRKFKTISKVAAEKNIFVRKTQFNPASGRKVFVPYMGDGSLIISSVLRSMGIDSDVMYADLETLKLGRKYTLGKECYPFIITTGDMLKTLRHNDPEKTAFFMPLTYGPCRFGQYNRLQRIILGELGYDVPIISPGAPESLSFAKAYGLSGAAAWRMFFVFLNGTMAVDYLGKTLRQIRPYEIHKGKAEQLYHNFLGRICDVVENSKSMKLADLGRKILEILKQARKEMEKIETVKVDKPRIGLVGEIYVRNHPFSNDEIVKKIEALGGEVLLPPYAEWGYHTNATTLLDLSVKQKEFFYGIFFGTDGFEKMSIALKNIILNSLQIAGNRIFRWRMDKVREEIEGIFDGFLHEKEPRTIYEIWNNAEPYIIKWFGEAALSIGKAIEWKKYSLDGVVNVLPFTCLPGNIVTAVSKKIKEDLSIPWINIAYDGLEQATTQIRLEAFFYHVKEYHRTNKNCQKTTQFIKH